jgi:dihydrofolate synthase/folylpolyglutamate synthase
VSPNNLQEWLDYQSNIHPKDIELGLARVGQVWQRMGAPAPASLVITVAGTNGKGSSVALLQAILGQAGYRVGAYTSPHLQCYNERISICGQLATDEALCNTFARVEQARGDISLTYFEFGTLAALWLFSQSQLDIAILEVGLGGRLDAVNIIDADVALITGIALDHADWLGDDVESIGAEKAGIMRAGKPVVYAAPEMPNSIAQKAQEVGAKLSRLGEDYHYERQAGAWHWQSGLLSRRSLPIPAIRGSIQLQNAAAVLQVIQCIYEIFAVDQQAIRQGLLSARLSGRLQVMQHRTRWILDVAHNPQAVELLSEQVTNMFVSGKVICLVGVLQDKLIPELFEPLLCQVDKWFVLDLSCETRGTSAAQVAALLKQQGSQPITQQTDSLENMCQKLIDSVSDEDLILVFGSFAAVAAVERWLAIE